MVVHTREMEIVSGLVVLQITIFAPVSDKKIIPVIYMNIIEIFSELNIYFRILIILAAALVGHLLVQEVKRLTQWLLTYKIGKEEKQKIEFTKRFPRVASLLTIFVSAVTFTIYFLAIGFILQQFDVSLTTYLASATILGLAIGFGLQGFVQDVIIGLTMIFSDALNLGEVVEMSGQIGRVDSVGLRFTVLVNILGQKIYIPNRNIVIINRYRRGVIRAYADIQIPDNTDEKEFVKTAQTICAGMYSQYGSIILSMPENLGIYESGKESWNYLRLKFRIWPGQNHIVESTFKQRMLAEIRKTNSSYADWMITVVYKAD